MTRINTNVSSLNAQKSLARSNQSLQDALTRLSTGLRINTGKDDPAGLIASEVLRSDITSTQQAITNTERANQVIATADSALGQVSSLLNDIRGLVVEAGNDGAMSDEQIAANQLQVDSSLEAINRIAQTTTFQGRKLLDGSLDFTTSTTAIGNFGNLTNLKIDQANLGTAGEMDVEINVVNAAAQAEVTTSIGAPVAADAAETVITFNDDETLTVTAVNDGEEYNNVTVVFEQTADVADDAPVVAYDAEEQKITVYVNNAGDTSMAAIDAAFDTFVSDYWTASASSAGAGIFDIDEDDDVVVTATAGGLDATEGLIADLVFELKGDKGSEVFSFEAGTEAAQIEAAINLVSDATGVSATNTAGTIDFTSVAYGSKAGVEVVIISEGAGGEFGDNFDAGAATGKQANGTDIEATVNGFNASGDGNTLSINTATLDLTASVAANEEDTITFTITGGGALFQLGPDVVSNQQARFGISSVNTASLRGDSGRLYQLGSGQTAALAEDATTASNIVDEVISQVASLRGRMGAFQKASLDANLASLTDAMENLSAAESNIRDTDFAAETAALTRSQILVQSGTSVLAIANQNPQNVLSLLR